MHFSISFQGLCKVSCVSLTLSKELIALKKSGYHKNESVTRVSAGKSMLPHVHCTVVAVPLPSSACKHLQVCVTHALGICNRVCCYKSMFVCFIFFP